MVAENVGDPDGVQPVGRLAIFDPYAYDAPATTIDAALYPGTGTRPAGNESNRPDQWKWAYFTKGNNRGCTASAPTTRAPHGNGAGAATTRKIAKKTSCVKYI